MPLEKRSKIQGLAPLDAITRETQFAGANGEDSAKRGNIGQVEQLIVLDAKGAANGIASLDGSGKVPAAQLPSYVDDVIEVDEYADLPVSGEAGKQYVTLDDNKVYRWSGSAYVLIGDVSVVLAEIESDISDLQDDVGDLEDEVAALSLGAALPRGYIHGLTVAVNASDAAHDHDIAAGVARSSDDTTNLVGAALTKRTDADWAAGNNQGGRQTALGNNALCHWLAIYHPSNGVDYICKPVATSLSLPSGYTKSRHIRYFRTNGSGEIIADDQDPKNPDRVHLRTPISEVNLSGNTTTTSVTVSSAAPPNCEADLSVSFCPNGVSGSVIQLYLRIRQLSEPDATPAFGTNFDFESYRHTDEAAITPASGNKRVLTNASSQYAYRKTNGTNGSILAILLNGWIDRRIP